MIQVFLEAVYFPNTDFRDANLGSSPSQICLAIHEGAGLLIIKRIVGRRKYGGTTGSLARRL